MRKLTERLCLIPSVPLGCSGISTGADKEKSSAHTREVITKLSCVYGKLFLSKDTFAHSSIWVCCTEIDKVFQRAKIEYCRLHASRCLLRTPHRHHRKETKDQRTLHPKPPLEPLKTSGLTLIKNELNPPLMHKIRCHKPYDDEQKYW